MLTTKLEKYMKERKHDSLSDGLDAVVADTNRIVPELSGGFNTERHRLSFQREAVINHQSADISVLQIQARRLTFAIFVDSPNNCLQLHTQKMSNRTKTHFGQCLTNPADVQKHDHSRNNNGTDHFQPRSYLPY